MADILQEFGYFISYRAALRGDFIADTPHHYTGIIAIIVQHIHHITFRPFVEVTVISVFTLGDVPFVERFDHHHKSHFVAQLHQFGSRHIVGSTNGVAAHIL